jgi:putative hydrolase of the HAD superfamily
LSQIRVILLDVNGTLLGYGDPLGFEKRFARACADLGNPVSVEQVCQAFSDLQQAWASRKVQDLRRASSDELYRRTMTAIYQFMLEALGIPGDLGQKADALYERFVVQEGFMPLFGDVQDALKRLRRQGVRLGILSNFPTHLEETLRQHGIHGYFDFFVVSSLVGLEKPDPAIFELAIERAGVPKEQILYVGDHVDDDIRGARAVGLSAILIDRHDRWPEADCVRIRSLSELAEVVGDPGFLELISGAPQQP